MAQVSSSIGMLTSHVQGLGFRSCEEIVLLGNKQVSNQASKQASKQNGTLRTYSLPHGPNIKSKQSSK